MNIVKVIYKDETVVARNKFIINKIVPLSIKNLSSNRFSILFLASQNYDDSYIYLKLFIDVDVNEVSSFNSHQLAGADCDEMLISKMNDANTFFTDFIFTEDESMYYSSKAIRKIDNSHCSLLDIYFPFDNFIKMVIFLKDILKSDIEEIFLSSKYFNMNLVNIETVKLDCTAKFEKDSRFHYLTHYTMNCGPSEFRLIYHIDSGYDRKLKEPLDYYTFMATYINDHNIDNFFVFNNDLYILYKKTRDYQNTIIIVLRLKEEIVDKTNFLHFEKIFEL